MKWIIGAVSLAPPRFTAVTYPADDRHRKGVDDAGRADDAAPVGSGRPGRWIVLPIPRNSNGDVQQHMPAHRPGPRARALAALASALPLALFGLTVSAAAFAPEQLRVLAYHSLPPCTLTLVLVAYAATAIATCRWRARLPVHALLVGLLFVAHMLVEAQPLGDVTTWRRLVETDAASMSELLANAVYRWMYRAGGQDGADLVAPIAGALLGLVVLGFVERHFVAAWPRRAVTIRLLGAAALVGGGWQVVCFRGFMENTLPSLPFVVLGLGAIAHYVPTGGRRSALLAGGLWLAIAGLMHGSATAMWPVALLAIGWRGVCGRASPIGLVRDGIATLAVMVATVATAVALLWAAGFALSAGHITGGIDSGHFVPLHPESQQFQTQFGMFDLAHFADVGNIFAFASPFLLAIAGLVGSRRWRRATVAAVRRQPVPAFAAAGAATFTATYNFDLRFPYDLDLMVALAAPTVPFLLQIAVRAPRRWRRWLWVGLLPNAAATWAVITALLVVAPTPGAAPGDLLRVNRRAGEVPIRHHEEVFVGLALPRDGEPPFTFSLYAFLGELSPPGGRPPRPDGLAFAPPGAPDADPVRSLLLIDPQQLGFAGVLSPPLTEPWLSPSLPGATQFGTWSLQALVRDARGHTTATNVLTIRPR